MVFSSIVFLIVIVLLACMEIFYENEVPVWTLAVMIPIGIVSWVLADRLIESYFNPPQ